MLHDDTCHENDLSEHEPDIGWRFLRRTPGFLRWIIPMTTKACNPSRTACRLGIGHDLELLQHGQSQQSDTMLTRHCPLPRCLRDSHSYTPIMEGAPFLGAMRCHQRGRIRTPAGCVSVLQMQAGCPRSALPPRQLETRPSSTSVQSRRLLPPQEPVALVMHSSDKQPFFS